MSKVNDGGSAFPSVDLEGQYKISTATGVKPVHYQKGMSLRDYFAAQAIIVLLSSGFQWDRPKSLSARSYAIADAMLEEREKGENNEC
jgi:hypothetical protein